MKETKIEIAIESDRENIINALIRNGYSVRGEVETNSIRRNKYYIIFSKKTK